jgi:hypothetical protein
VKRVPKPESLRQETDGNDFNSQVLQSEKINQTLSFLDCDILSNMIMLHLF